MRLTVVTPEGARVDTPCTSVTVPGNAGEFGILPGHRPLISSLAIGDLRYVVEGETHHLAINEGFAEIHDDEVVIVTATAEKPDQIDVDRARLSAKLADDELASLDAKAAPELANQALEKRRRADNRIKVASFK